MFPGVTEVKFPLVPFDTAFWNPRDFDLIINAITCIETISSVCSKIDYSNLNTPLTQTFHLLLALRSVCETPAEEWLLEQVDFDPFASRPEL